MSTLPDSMQLIEIIRTITEAGTEAPECKAVHNLVDDPNNLWITEFKPDSKEQILLLLQPREFIQANAQVHLQLGIMIGLAIAEANANAEVPLDS